MVIHIKILNTQAEKTRPENLTIVDDYSTHRYITNIFYVEESHITQTDLLE